MYFPFGNTCFIIPVYLFFSNYNNLDNYYHDNNSSANNNKDNQNNHKNNNFNNYYTKYVTNVNSTVNSTIINNDIYYINIYVNRSSHFPYNKYNFLGSTYDNSKQD